MNNQAQSPDVRVLTLAFMGGKILSINGLKDFSPTEIFGIADTLHVMAEREFPTRADMVIAEMAAAAKASQKPEPTPEEEKAQVKEKEPNKPKLTVVPSPEPEQEA